MSDFLKRAAGLIFNVEDNDPEQTKETVSPAKKTGSGNTAAAIPNNTATSSSSGTNTPDAASVEKFKAYFKSLYDKGNLPGPDFYEYFNMVEAMGNLIADEVTYPSVFAGFGGQLTKEKLVASGQHYIDLLQSDRTDFDKSFQIAKQQKVVERKGLADKKAAEIKALQDKIAALNQDIVQLNQQAMADELRLNTEQAAYYQQSDSFQQKIKNGIEQIQQYIK